MSARPNDIDLRACEVLWNFNAIERNIADPDLILVMGSSDLHVAWFAANLAQDSPRSFVICSGGMAHDDDLLSTGWNQPEGDVFASAMVSRGADPLRVAIERCATNTAENVVYSRRIAEEAGMNIGSVLVVQKPFMCLRALLTTERNWDGVRIGVTHEAISFAEYFERFGKAGLVDIIVGDTWRIVTYPGLGYFSVFPIPSNVREAMDFLIERGFTAHMPAR